MTGRVDDFGRPLVSITVRHPAGDKALAIDAWIDTGYTGHLMLLPEQIAALGLPSESFVNATLADGSRTQYPTYKSLVEWPGIAEAVEVFGGANKFALLGLRLLEDSILTIDYPARTVTVERSPRA